jgi:hypothetical protein
MQILGVEGMTVEQVHRELSRGGKFVLFEYCISILILTFKRPSDIYFIRAGESAVAKSLQFTLLSLVAGWWGFPWGPIYTISSVVTNLGGGRDVTRDVMQSLARG